MTKREQEVLSNLRAGYHYWKNSASTGVKCYVMSYDEEFGYCLNIHYEQNNPVSDPYDIDEDEVLRQIRQGGWTKSTRN